MFPGTFVREVPLLTRDTVTKAVRVITSTERPRALLGTSLYTNTGYLVADVAVVSSLGFVAFWVLVARLYSPAQVGLAAATVAALFALSDKLLPLFGSAYSESGNTLLRIQTLSAISVDINYLGLSVMRVKRNTRGVMLVSASIAGLALGSGYILMTRAGLLGIGVAWIAAQTLVTVAVVLFHRLYRSH